MPPEENQNPPQAPVPPQQPVPSAPPGIPKIRTFKSDAQIYMNENKVSSFDVASKSYVAQTPVRAKLTSINYKSYIYGIAAVLVLGIAGYFGYQSYLGNTPAGNPEIVKQESHPPFLQAESETELSFARGDSASLINAIKQVMSQQFKYGSINYLKIRPGGSSPYSTASDFIKTMSWNPPASFFTSIEPQFNVFIVYQSPYNAPVFVFRTKNFSAAYASLLEWETGSGWQSSTLWQDLKPFINLQNTDPASLYKKTFEDDLIKNNDARAFRTPEGQLLMEYALFSKRFIVISPSRGALELILDRLIALPPQ